ncbi:hypothetical protein GGX14DRAFT_144879 [Mycena pura]|uniref:Uncharacterized protein n=1 Tax=Mycena pura TaxID=153505 RepID=A0AAD6YN96_9AGAR|nr:hypothetical protein GGX14DRAFT_144879 [Mycena pura]
MTSLALSNSHSQASLRTPPSPGSLSSSSSKKSLKREDEENLTITAKLSPSTRHGKQKSQEDLRLLAISTHMTELSYTISDIQTRIFDPRAPSQVADLRRHCRNHYSHRPVPNESRRTD